MADNIYAFSGFKTAQEVAIIKQLLVDESGNIRTFQQFKKDVLALNATYNVRYLRAEYDHVTAAAQMAANWQQLARDEDDYYLVYDTAGDDRVRPTHKALDGIALPASHEFWKIAYPPNDWGCRCAVRKVWRSQIQISNPAEALQKADIVFNVYNKNGTLNTKATLKRQLFSGNVGQTGIIFPTEGTHIHPYAQVAPDIFNFIKRKAKEIEQTQIGIINEGFTEQLLPQFNVFIKPDEPLKAFFTEALTDFDKVIPVAKLGRVEINSVAELIEYEGEKAVGLFNPDTHIITISDQADMLTIFHELAHFYDYVVLGKGKSYLSMGDSKILKEWEKSIRNSQHFQKLKADYEIGKNVRYYYQLNELFARSVSEYVAIKSNNEKALNALVRKIDKHWTSSDFIPIFETLENIFKSDKK